MNATMKLAIAAVMLVSVTLGGCATTSEDLEPAPIRPTYAQSVGDVTSGSIFRDGAEVAYFEDLKARRVGDILTIRLQENTNASKSANTKAKKDSETSLAAPTIAGRPVTVNGTEVLDMSVTGEREFTGEGSSSQSNRLVGSVTVTVVERLPNGNLMVEGEKWLTLNQGDELVRVSGVVRPYDIAPDNTVTSDKVANARIRYSGKGHLADSNRAGWLARFFTSPVWPY